MANERKILISHNKLAFEFEVNRIQSYADILNKLVENLSADFGDSVYKFISRIPDCLTEQKWKDENLRELIFDMLLEATPHIHKSKISNELKRQMLSVDSINIDKYKPFAEQIFNNRGACLKYVSRYRRKFVLTKENKEKVFEKFAQYISGEENLRIYDKLKELLCSVEEFQKIANVDMDNVNLTGLGIQSLSERKINYIPFR